MAQPSQKELSRGALIAVALLLVIASAAALFAYHDQRLKPEAGALPMPSLRKLLQVDEATSDAQMDAGVVRYFLRRSMREQGRTTDELADGRAAPVAHRQLSEHTSILDMLPRPSLFRWTRSFDHYDMRLHPRLRAEDGDLDWPAQTEKRRARHLLMA